MKDLSEMEQINITKGLGGVYHQTRLQVLLDDLGSVDSMYRSMLETAEKSEGSALKENEKYMESLEAKINLVRVELEKLIVAVGEAFLTDGMITFLQVAGNVLNTFAAMTKTFGALPILLGTGGVALALLSSRFRNLVVSIYSSISAMKAKVIANRALSTSTATSSAAIGMASVNLTGLTTATVANTAATAVATTATNGFKTALRGLMIATGVGAAFVAVGFVLEKIIGSMGSANTSAQELASSNKILMESYENNKSTIDGLLPKYIQLEEAMKHDPSVDTMTRYRDVMDELGTLLPDLVTGEDQFGNKIIMSSSATEIKIGLMKEQLEIQKQLNAEENRGKIEQSIDVSTESLEKAKDKVEDYLSMLTNGLNGIQYNKLSPEFKVDFVDSNGKPIMKNVEDLMLVLDKLKGKLAEAEVIGDKKNIDMLQSQIKQTERYFDMIQGDSRNVNKEVLALKNNYIELVSSTISGTDKMENRVKKYAEELTANMLKIADASDVTIIGETLDKVFNESGAGGFVNNITKEFNKLDTATADTFSSMSTSVQSFIDKLPSSLEKYGFSDDEIQAIQRSLQGMLNSSIADFNKFENSMRSNNSTLEQSRALAAAVGEGISELGDDAEDTSKSMEDLTSNISYINGILEDYAENNKLSASSILEIIEKHEELLPYINDEARLIEELTKIRDKDIEAAKRQINEKLEINSEYYKLNIGMLESYTKEHFKFYNEDLKKFANLAELKADVEKKLIEHLSKQWSTYYDTISKSFVGVGESIKKNQAYHLPDGDTSNYTSEIDASQRATNDANRQLQESRRLLEGLKFDDFSIDFNSIGTSLDKNTKSAKESSKATKESIYLSNKFKQALEAVNLEIEKQQALQSQHPTHSETYRKSLEDQLKLEREKLKLIKDQATALDKQIKSGKIAQTGSVTIDEGVSKSTTTSPSKLDGWGKITSNYLAQESFRKSPHTGIDLASKKGARLDANVDGKVTQTGKTALSGNFVKILDDKGLTHFYGHLDKITVKMNDAIKAGMQIGNIGNTGNVVAGKGGDGSHLHYEIKDSSGKNIDPTSYAKSAQTMIASSQKVSSVVSTTAQSIDEALSTKNGLDLDEIKQQQVIADLEEKKASASTDYYDHLISGIDRSIQKSRILAEQQLEHSKEYRTELENEVKQQEYKQSVLHKQANQIREQLKNTELSPKFKDALTTQLSELTLAWWDVEESIESTNEKIENSKIAEFDKKIEDLNRTISKSTALMDLYTKGTAEHNAEQKKIITTLHEKQRAYEDEADTLRRLLQTEKMTMKERQRNQERLNELASQWLDTQSEIISINSGIADELLSVMKESYEQQRDYEVALKEQKIDELEEAYKAKVDLLDEEGKAYEDSIKSQMDDLEKSHKDKLDKIEEESKAFEEAIERQLKLMRRQREEEGFDKEIDKLQEEELTIVNQINELSMDDSREARLKRKKLEEDLVKIREQIGDKQNDRQYDLREQNLQDELEAYKSQVEAKQESEDNTYNIAKEALDNQLEFYKKELEAKKKMEEEKYNASKKQMEREIRDIKSHYESLINNERENARLREEIINGSIDGISSKLSAFLQEFKNMNKGVTDELGLSWQELENQIYRITQAQGSMSNITVPSDVKDLITGTVTSQNPNNSSSTGKKTVRDEAWDKYLANKQIWETASKSEKARLNAENEKMRKTWGFRDGSYSELSKLDKYHDGGIVGGKGSRLTELANKLFNAKPNEQAVLALKNELFVPEVNVPNMFDNIRSVIPTITPAAQQGGIIQIDNLVNIDNVSNNANLDIDRLIEQGMNRLVDKMKPYGFRLT